MAVATAQVTVTTTATALTAADTDGQSGQSVTCYSDTAFYLGSASVTSGAGFLTVANTPVTLTLEPGEVLYGRTASGSVTVFVLRTGT
jgi:hypothetical protein